MCSRNHVLRCREVLTLGVLLALLVPGLRAGEAKPAQPLTPADLEKLVPKCVDELKLLQAQVLKVVEKAIPATVGVDLASGVIISKDGYVLTAAHVAKVPGREIPVILHDGRQLKGKVLGLCWDNDAALVKITDKGPWPFVELGEFKTVKPGNWCLGVGHPRSFRLGRAPVVRLGRVLLANEHSVTAELFMDGGDSGGPVFDLHGRVIGTVSGDAGEGSLAAYSYTAANVFRQNWDRLAKSENWGKMSGISGGDIQKADTKSNPKIRAAFRPIVADAAKSTVRVRCGGKDVALGTIVGPDGWVLTRAAALAGPVEVHLKDNPVHKARVVGVHPAFDLAMLKIDASGLPAVAFADGKIGPVGTWVASVGTGNDPLAFGVISVAARDLRNEKLLNPRGNLGVSFGGGESGEVVVGSPRMAQTELKKGDILLSIGKTAIVNQFVLTDALRDFKPGDIVALKVKRGKEELLVKVQLSGPAKVARRYPLVLQHDAYIPLTSCGGPLVDLDGRVIGINIASFSAVERYAIPADAIRPLLFDLASGKLAPPRMPDTRK